MSVIERQGVGFNSDLSNRVVLNTSEEIWKSSPSDGVNRLYLDRTDFSEYTSATSIVKFEKGSSFPSHAHPNGEEFYVLDGTFSDEYGHYPKGTYVRNPHGTCHNPYSKEGCKIFVKLRQFQKDDNTRIVKNVSQLWNIYNDKVDYINLHEYKNEIAYVVKFKPNSAISLPFRNVGGEEILILSGSVNENRHIYEAITWIRDPKRCFSQAHAGTTGVSLFVKSGHLF